MPRKLQLEFTCNVPECEWKRDGKNICIDPEIVTDDGIPFVCPHLAATVANAEPESPCIAEAEAAYKKLSEAPKQ